MLCRSDGPALAAASLRAAHAALKSPGVLLLLTHGPPALRMPLIQACGWQVVHTKVLVPPDLAVLASAEQGAAAGLQVVEDFCEGAAPLAMSACFLYICKK